MSNKKKKNPPNEETMNKPEAASEALNAEESAQEAVSAEDAQAQAMEADEEVAQAEAQSELAEALAAATAKQEEYLTLAQRVQADFDNYRRRNQSVRHDAYEEGARAFAATLLPVIDNLERAIGAAQDSPDESLKSGVEMVQRQMVDAFAKRGITAIDRKGEKFDPNLENAVLQGTAEDGEPGTVCEVLQKGYQMETFVLRHAMVKVVPE
ncbi:MAG: nucleotide exchange factor GrpE [Eubacteriales bacterium]|nr:nucleotide exchange factor GrpE [Eubacteriales bacterium]